MEQVRGRLNGVNGSFALQHYGSMEAGNFDLNVRMVPGSGTEGLAGIAGAMTILIDAGKHPIPWTTRCPKRTRLKTYGTFRPSPTSSTIHRRYQIERQSIARHLPVVGERVGCPS